MQNQETSHDKFIFWVGGRKGQGLTYVVLANLELTVQTKLAWNSSEPPASQALELNAWFLTAPRAPPPRGGPVGLGRGGGGGGSGGWR